MKTSLTPGYSSIFFPQVRLMVALAREFLGAENTASRSLIWVSEEEQGLGSGVLRAVFSSGLTNTDTFLVESHEKSKMARFLSLSTQDIILDF